MRCNWITLGIVICSVGCSDCREEQQPPNGSTVSDVGADVRLEPDAALGDTSPDGAPDAGADAQTPSNRYDPALEDLGAEPTDCDLAIGAQSDTADARFFIASHRVDLEDLRSQESFREAIHRQVFDLLGCRHPTAPNVVVFPESMSLPMLAIGETASRAREAATAEAALTTLALAVPDAFRHYGGLYPEAAIGTRLLLARTDAVVRATIDTFSALAARYGIWISVTVDLPDFERDAEADFETLADPDYEQHDYAYVATTPAVTNRQYLFAPDGSEHDMTEKTYVTQLELDQLGLTPGDFMDIGPMPTPWGRTGVVISKPAWMVDVQDRLDDLGTQVYLQPEAFAGGWTLQTRPTNPARWEPDVFIQGGWNLLQRSSRGTVNLVPQFTGHFFDIVFDAQLQIIEHTARSSAIGSFVGQESLVGQAQVGPWAIVDPGASDPSLTLEERRAELRRVGEELAAGTADPTIDYVEGWLAHDVDLYDGAGTTQLVETHPVVHAGDDALWVAFSRGEPGDRNIVVRRYDDPAAPPTGEFEVEMEATRDGDLFRPRFGADGATLSYERMTGAQNTVQFGELQQGDDGFQFVATAQVESAFRGVPLPDALSDGGDLVVARIDGANRVAFRGPGEPVQVESRPQDRPVLRANQWDPDVAHDGDDVLVVWTDFKNWRWEIWGALSDDGGATWGEPFGIALGSDAVETFHSTPRALAIDGRFVVAWTDLQSDRLRSEVRVSTIEPGAPPTVAEPTILSAPADWAWRPSGVVEAGSVRFVWEAMNPDGSRAVETAVFDALAGTASAPVELVARTDARLNFPFVALYGGATWVGYELTEAGSSSSSVQLVEAP